MQLEHFIEHLDKIRQSQRGFDYKLGEGVQLGDFVDVEESLNIRIPDQIKSFYLIANGLKTIHPDFKLIEIDLWEVDLGLIHFATFDKSIKVNFNTKELNEAGEWTVLTDATNYEVTLTISSFWSNKIWHWIKHNRPIWADRWWID
ncbi:SMI1/KNR4 family protein [Lewinella sp. IMCC34183]|uniref:SMI1/KNR4 family protein n=1 Tax=Lewinella sp. IMCC34183 TaxID=2248762 RepID=UPI000E23E65B|nr:SMI1/KNR4 family protein [Lewinella sp. IMCC34183]